MNWRKEMKNYYEILEVDKNASSEIIEKAYRILAKRYHPDLQDSRKKEYDIKSIRGIRKIWNMGFRKITFKIFIKILY